MRSRDDGTRARGSTRALPRVLLILAAVTLAARIATAMLEGAHPSAVKDAMPWRAIGDAEALARQTNRPILYDFSAEWCAPCRAMQSEVFADPGKATSLAHMFVPVRVVDRQREEGRNPLDVQALQDRYHIQAFPTLVVVDPDSGEVARLEGYPGASTVMRTLGDAATKYNLAHGQFRAGGIVIK